MKSTTYRVFTLIAACIVTPLGLAAGAETAAVDYSERFRPQYHFSPPRNWMNDPNGLVYYDGEFHLFYQYNPFGNKWGHMSWGHAVSNNLVSWQHLPLAIPEQAGVMAFSGSAVVDWKNTSGFGVGDAPPLIAIYTGRETEPVRHQAQYIAYSNDRGRTWKQFSGNPVIDRHIEDFRDPKVSWFAPGGYWVMTTVLAAERKVAFYRSADLKKWTLLSEFGPAGSATGVWECPDLFTLPVRNAAHEEKWVLVVNVGDGAINGGSGCQYFVGNFDGTAFTPDKVNGEVPTRWADYGRDFYAAVSWSDVPATDGRRLWIGWMNNWKYAQDIPTDPWRSAQSLVRELDLVRVGESLHLAQRPIPEYSMLRTDAVALPARSILPGQLDLAPSGVGGNVLELKAILEPAEATEVGFTVFAGESRATKIGYDRKQGSLYIDRTGSGDEFHKDFSGRHQAPLSMKGGSIALHIFLDRSTIEVFADDGRVVISDQSFPPAGATAVGIYAVGGTARLVGLQAWHLKSIWNGDSNKQGTVILNRSIQP